MARMKTSLISIVFALTVLGVSAYSESAATLLQNFEEREDRQPIKVTIATVSPLLDAPTQSYRFGQQIPVAINHYTDTIMCILCTTLIFRPFDLPARICEFSFSNDHILFLVIICDVLKILK